MERSFNIMYTTRRKTTVKTIEVSEGLIYLTNPPKMRTSNPPILENIPEEVEIEDEDEEESVRNSNEEESETEEEFPPERNTILKVGPALQALGYQWGPNSKNWILWAIWEPCILERLSQFSQMNKDQYSVMADIEFFNIINFGFLSICFDRSFVKIKPEELRYMVFQLDFNPEVERYSHRSKIVEIKGTELFFNNSSGNASLRFRQTSIIACSGLAEILRATCSPTDLLIFSGSFQRVFSDNGQYFLLTNYNNNNEMPKLQIVRLSFMATEEIRMIEKIKPTPVDNRFEFKYFARSPNGKNSREVSLHKEFHFLGTSHDFRQHPAPTGTDIPVPIQDGHDVYEIYIYLLSTIPPRPKPPTRSSSSHRTENRLRNSTPTMCEDLEENHDVDESIELFMNDNDMPVFSARRGSYPVTRFPVFQNNPEGTVHRHRNGTRREVHYENQPPRVRGSGRVTSNPNSNMPQVNASLLWERVLPDYETISNVFIIMGKLSVIIFAFIGVLAFINMVIVSPPCNVPERKFSSNQLDDIMNEYDNNVTGKSVFVQLKDMIASILIWLENNCGIECIRRRLGINITSGNGPIV